jgi:lysozyme
MNLKKLRLQLIDHEGLERFPYRCPAGKLTIGVGRNLEDNGISDFEARYMLENDIQECLYDCLRIFPEFIRLSDSRQRVLIDMRFNLGPEGFRMFKKFIDAVNRGRFGIAAQEMVDSKWFGQVGQRAKTLVAMLAREDDE